MRPGNPVTRQRRPTLSRLHIEKLRFKSWGPIDLTIEPSACVCLSGPSGSGKTLFLRAIADMDDHEGKAYIDELECQSVSAPDWRRMVGILPAESRWWHDEVGPHFTASEDRWLQMLSFDAEVMGWSVHRLSTGERQRLALARLLCNRPRVLLLDEPTASLDPESVRRAEEVIAIYRRETGCPVLWVSHDSAQIERVAGRHFLMRDGHLTEGAIG